MVRNLEARAPLVRILEQIDVGALVEAVVRGVGRGRPVEVVDVSVAAQSVSVSDWVVRRPGRAVVAATHSQRGYLLLARPGSHVARGSLRRGLRRDSGG